MMPATPPMLTVELLTVHPLTAFAPFVPMRKTA